jgi:hypothetical protein
MKERMNGITKAEQYLLDKIRRGNKEAWSEFVDRYRGRLFSFARAKLVQAFFHCSDARSSTATAGSRLRIRV